MLLGNISGTCGANNLHGPGIAAGMRLIWDNWRVWAMEAGKILGLELALRNLGWRF